jgi:phospholipid/cholesterol/gamma-HCH transport system permease protein
MIKILEYLGAAVIRVIEDMGQIVMILLSALVWTFRPPLRLGAIIKQMEFVGVKSLFVVVLTGAFTAVYSRCKAFTAFPCSGGKAWSARPWPWP